ncbi:translation initiation factor IF-3 [Myceligenerans pegani]|uniref:translation initiation factor IF-3 n=1 Tax=Myceligenerans pegani TaxID=2776917 RepID=UPI00299E62EC|nr:translation initiation factor IF-3 [Myceligenerans sp. TRM 65318]
MVHLQLPRSITISEPRINDRIRVPEVRLIGPGGEQVGVVATAVALKLAQDADLDLVEVAPNSRPPVAKLMDFGKYKYESDMKAREARRNQTNTILKEIRFRLKIDPHDYETKKGHVERFLSAGDKVKVMIMFRGREQSRPEMGRRLLERLADDVVELGFVESMPKQDGRNMTMVLGPVKKKAETKTERPTKQRGHEKLSKSQARRAAEAAEAAAAAETESPAEDTARTPAASSGPASAPAAAAPEPDTRKPAPRPRTAPAPKPAAAKPAAAPKPATSKPATAKPAVPKPAAKPAAPKPAAPKPRAPRKG